VLGIGDIDSDQRGTGARFNSGKIPFDLVPLKIVAEEILRRRPDSVDAKALFFIGLFQVSHDPDYLFMAIDELGIDGWLECARVFEYGKKKYAAWNWAKGMPWSVPLACAARHLLQMMGEGGYAAEDDDFESKQPHRGHVFCNIVMLLTYVKHFPEGNDLPAKELMA
jgi:hypothetical protein